MHNRWDTQFIAAAGCAQLVVKEAQAAENAARDHHVLSLGKVASMQSRCEEQFGPLYLDVQRITGNLRDNGDPLARLVFPHGLTGARNLLAPEMRREVRRMHAAIKNEAVAEGLTGHLKPLAELDKALREAVQRAGAWHAGAGAEQVCLGARRVPGRARGVARRWPGGFPGRRGT